MHIHYIKLRINKGVGVISIRADDFFRGEYDFSLCVDLIQEGIWVLNTEERTIYVNSKMAEMLGETIDEMAEKHLFEFVAEEDLPDCKESLVRRKQGVTEQLDFNFLHKSGKKVFTRMGTAPVYTSEGDYAGAVALVTDITTQKQREEALRRTEDSLQTVVENILDVFVKTDVHCNCLYVSPSSKRTLGYEALCLTGRCAFELMHPEDLESVRALFVQMVEGETVENPEFRMRHAAGHYIWVEVVGKALYDLSGKFDFAAFVIRDISERKLHEKEMLKAARLESIGLLAGGITHDFNNLLAVVLGNLSLAKLLLNKPHQILERLEKSEEAALQAKDLSNRLLAFSKGEIPQKEVITIEQLLGNALLYSVGNADIKYVQEISEGLHPIKADAGQIGQVFINILLNAVQVVSEDGTVRVRAENFLLTDGDIQGTHPLAPGCYVKISFSDDGPGILQEDMDKIFEPFFSTKNEGYGLGLATAHYLIDKHDGCITVDSRLGEGTTFDIYLPAFVTGGL